MVDVISREFPHRTLQNGQGIANSLCAFVSVQLLRANLLLDAIVESKIAGRIAGSQRRSLTTSAILHALVLLSAALVWPHAFHNSRDAMPSVVPVELVTIGDKTNIAPMIQEELPLPPGEQQVAPPPPPAPADVASLFEMKLFPQKPLPETQSRMSSAGMQASAPPLSQVPSSGQRTATIGDRNIKGVGDESAMTMSLSDALRNQIAQCWHPIDNTRSQLVSVTFQLFFNIDGSVSQPPRQLSSTTTDARSDTGLRTVEEEVRRAIYTCAPYRLPARRFAEWQTITLTFDPRIVVDRSIQTIHGH